MNKCTKSATLDMSNTKLLVHRIGTVKSDLPQSTLETQLRVWGMLLVDNCVSGQLQLDKA